ncbi:hypothetical protein NKG94_01055 [Micromonospora sp. M12]
MRLREKATSGRRGAELTLFCCQALPPLTGPPSRSSFSAGGLEGCRGAAACAGTYGTRDSTKDATTDPTSVNRRLLVPP